MVFHLLSLGVYATPSSDNFQLRDYSFGGGGLEDGSSENFSLFGIVGDVSQGGSTSETFQLRGGIVWTILPGVPPAPTVANSAQWYDRLTIILNPDTNPADATYAIMITETSDTNWTSARYVQSDFTRGTILGLEDFLTYSGWGGAGGFVLTGLEANQTYKIRAKARQGEFTETAWGPEAIQQTYTPTLSFGVDADGVIFDQLSSGNNYTDATKSSIVTTTTNAYNGYIVYAYATQPLTANANTIPHYASPNSAPTAWTGTGFGYSSNDTDLVGGTPDRFTDGGPRYAGFTNTYPGDPVASTDGPILSLVEDEEFTIAYRVQATDTTPAGSYKTTIVYIIVPTF